MQRMDLSCPRKDKHESIECERLWRYMHVNEWMFRETVNFLGIISII
jgi:hypothetical protein